MIYLLKVLLNELQRTRKVQLCLLLMLMVLVSFSEIVSIGAVIPFVGVLISPETIFNNERFGFLMLLLGVQSPDELIFPATVIFMVIVVISSFLRLALLILQSRLGYAIGADIGYKLFSRTLFQRYIDFVKSNSSEIISAITKKANSCVSSSIIPLMNVISASITLSFVLLFLLFLDPVLTTMTLVVSALMYGIIVFKNRKKLLENGENISSKNDLLIKIVQEGLGSFRNIAIDGTQDFYRKIFRQVDVSLRASQASNQLMAETPKYVMEGFGIIAIAWISYSYVRNGSALENVLPLISVLVIGAQRILPVLQKGYAGWSQMKGEQQSLKDIVALLKRPVLNQADIERKPHKIL